MSDIQRRIPITRSGLEKIFPKLTPAQISCIEARGHISTVQLRSSHRAGRDLRSFFCSCLRRDRGYSPSGAVDTLITVRPGQFTGKVNMIW
jgi:thioredoxin reductase (NADPH)